MDSELGSQLALLLETMLVLVFPPSPLALARQRVFVSAQVLTNSQHNQQLRRRLFFHKSSTGRFRQLHQRLIEFDFLLGN